MIKMKQKVEIIQKNGGNVKIIINRNGMFFISDRKFKRSGCPICYKEKNRKLSIKTNDIRQMELRI